MESRPSGVTAFLDAEFQNGLKGQYRKTRASLRDVLKSLILTPERADLLSDWIGFYHLKGLKPSC